MTTISHARHQFPPAIIRHAVWLYLRPDLSYRDVEDMLADRGLDLTYETVRRWVSEFGPPFAEELRKRRPRPTSRWHLGEMVMAIAGKRHWLWRAGTTKAEPAKGPTMRSIVGWEAEVRRSTSWCRRGGTPAPQFASCAS